MSKTTITAIILTYNESKHITRCIGSLKGVCSDICVVDSYSTDNTIEIARSFGARVFQNRWTNYSQQFNWALSNCEITSSWIWRVDADEYITPELREALRETIDNVEDDVNGIYLHKRIDFMGRPLMHGGWYPVFNLKIIRFGYGDCENRWMDEHLRIFEGRTIKVEQGAQVDHNLNDLTWWIEKHNGYATREVIDLLMMEYEMESSGTKVTPKLFGTDEQRKRWLKTKYIKAPLFVRPFINFTYRYLLRAGFLDGVEGFIWHILQGFWYRFLVDAKLMELKRSFGGDKKLIIKYIKEKYQ
ncbi:MAG: glycosyltransferase family 2 protein [Rikenellaceae bacterium]